MAKKETKAVATVQGAVPAMRDEEQCWGAENIDANDVLIPKLLLMQGLSDFVAQGKANIGDYVKSTTGEIVAQRGDKVVFVPISTSKHWRIMEEEGGRYQWRRNEEWTPDNANAEMQWVENGTNWRRDRTLSFFVLLAKDIKKERDALEAMASTGEMQEGDNVLIPCQLQFVRTSYNTGKQLITEFAKAKKFRKPPAAWMYALSARQEKNDQGIYQVMELESAGLTDPRDLTVAYEWYKTITHSNVAVHEADAPVTVSEEEPPPPSAEVATDDGKEVPF